MSHHRLSIRRAALGASTRRPMSTLTFTPRILVVLAALLIVAIGLMADSCDTTSGGSQPQQQQQQQNSTANDRLHKAEPYPILTDSQELHNQRQWYLRLNDPNKVAYLYLITMDGKVFAEYQIIAKCSSTNSQYSTPAEVQLHDGQYNGGNLVVPAPQPDGSYGQNEQAIFCFLDDANRTMIEFSEQWHYLWSEQPLALTTPPTIIVTPNGK